MAGCDFLPNIPNVGIKRALKYITASGDYIKV
jgi:5'-3' exonuclease